MFTQEHKLFFTKVIKFFIVLVLIDLTLGYGVKKLFLTQETGKYARINHAVNETTVPILVFGSSHVIRQYIPEIISNTLRQKTLNVGAEGQQLLYHYALQKMILKRYKPKLMIVNIDEDWLFQSEVAHKRLADLHPFYPEHKEILKPILKLKSPWVDYKLLFKAYQNNSTVVHIVKYFLVPQVDYSGYRPLDGSMVGTELIDISKIKGEYSAEEIDPDFVSTLVGIIDTAKRNQTNLVFVTSPKPVKMDFSSNKSYLTIRKIAEENGIPLIDFSGHKAFIGKLELFSDPAHLNHKGSQIFTKMMADSVQTILDK